MHPGVNQCLRLHSQVPDPPDGRYFCVPRHQGRLSAGWPIASLRKCCLSLIYGFPHGGADGFSCTGTCGDHDEHVKALVAIFHAPFTLDHLYIPGSYRETCGKLGIPLLLNESGMSLNLDKEMAREAVEGVIRVLSYLGMLAPGRTCPDAAPPEHREGDQMGARGPLRLPACKSGDAPARGSG